MERDCRIDKIRAIAIFFVVAHHCVVNDIGLQGFLLKGELLETPTIYIFLNAIFIIGVNLFFLASGYCRIIISLKKVVSYILTIYITFLPIQLIGFLTGWIDLNKKTILQTIDPLDYYWFLMVYLFILLFSPFYNKLVDKLEISDSALFCLIIIVVFCGYGFFIDKNLNIGSGYSFLMASALYILGGIIKKHKDYILSKYSGKKILYIYLITVLTNTIIICTLNWFEINDFSWNMYSYNNPLVFVSSLSFFIFFLTTKNKWNFAEFIAKSTLSVYIFHSTCWLSTIRGMGLKVVLVGINCLDWIILLLYAIFVVFLGAVYHYILKKSVFGFVETLSVVTSNFLNKKFKKL
ncbi:MAG: acyltransferase family protein [Lachnospiraceae bacterium]|nr:acyltransferase family protein [Lachnospiraceae bacterium]